MVPARTPTPAPESYVVRIYRREAGARRRIAGTVEIVAERTERSFNGLRELERILGAGPTASPPRHGRKGGPT